MPFDDAWLQRDGLLGGRFQVEAPIKEGKFTALYRMVDQQDRKPWILRVHIGPTELKDQAEFQHTFGLAWHILSQLEHPRLPRLMDGFSLEGRTYLLRELVEGRSILDIISEDKPIDESLVRDWGGQICDIVHFLHQKGIFLGVVRPNDVYVTPDGTIRLADYGPLLFWPQARRAKIVKEWLGGMASPEALRGQELRVSSDVYAIGALLHYCLTRIKPRTHSSPFTLLGKHRDDVSRDINRVIMRCLSFSPDGRFDDVRALKVALLGQAGPMGSPQADVAVKLSATPQQLLFRDVDPKKVPVQTLTIMASGPEDRVSLSSNVTWVLINPNGFEGERAEIAVSVDAAQLLVDQVTEGALTLAGKKGNVITVPISASLRAQGVARSGTAVSVMLQLVLPFILALGTVFLLPPLHTEIAHHLAARHPSREDVNFARYLTQGFSAWMLLQTLLLPVVSLVVFSKVNPLQRTRVFPAYVLTLFYPAVVLWLVTVFAESFHFPNHQKYLIAWTVAWLANGALFSEFAWTNRLPAAVGKAMSALVRLTMAASMLVALVLVFH